MYKQRLIELIKQIETITSEPDNFLAVIIDYQFREDDTVLLRVTIEQLDCIESDQYSYLLNTDTLETILNNFIALKNTPNYYQLICNLESHKIK